MIDILEQLDFSPNDAAVFSALVEVGPCFVAPLAKIVKKHRQVIYNSLISLEEKHFITVSQKNGKNYYSISDPHRLLDQVRQKEVLALALVERIETKQKHDHEQVEVFTGASAYEEGTADFRRRAEEAKEYIVVRSDTHAWFTQARPFFSYHVDELRRLRRKGIDIMIVFFEHERNHALQFLGKYIFDPYICKMIPDEFKIPESFWLAGDHIYIVTPTADPMVIHIRSKALAANYREYFWSVWGKGKTLEPKVEN
jgi:sugar-specific transcriptional regulator TrmB